jgi:hypothetical protein
MTALPIPVGGLRPAPEPGIAKPRPHPPATNQAKATAAPAAGAGAKPAPGPPKGLDRTQRIANLRRGQAYDAAHKFDYEHREVVLKPRGGGRPRLDGYKPGQAIVSRKETQLAQVTLKSALQYVREVPKKYAPRTPIAKVKSNKGIKDTYLRGQMYLEVPVQIEPVPRAVLDEAQRLDVIIRDVTGREYH